VIRTYNESIHLEKTLNIIDSILEKKEIIIIDSYSTDNTLEIAKEHNAKVFQLLPFNYSKALNIGISKSSNELISILSAHCFIQNDDFFQIMSSHFVNKKVAGVYARQIPSEKSNILDKRNLTLIYRNTERPINNPHFFNNAASMIRKSVWRRFPFNENIEMMEDIEWERRVRNAGFHIIYEPRAVVEHFHDNSISDTLKRYVREVNSLVDLGEIG